MRYRILTSLICGCLSAPSVWAADIDLRGFASFVGGSTFSSNDELYDYDDTLNFRNDSLIALQIDATLDEKLSATMQFMSRGEDQYNAEVEWAYFTYKFTDNLQLSAGRIRIPFYRYSDFIDVRYAYNWVEVPSTVYGLDLPGFDGMSLVYDSSFSSWDSTLQVMFGQIDGNDEGITIENLTGFNWTLNRDWLTLRAGYMVSKVSIEIAEFAPLLDAVNAFGLPEVASNIMIDGDDGTFLGLALGIDYNNILFDAEYIEYEISDSLLPKTNAYYAMGGYRFGAFTPYVMYSESESEPNTDAAGAVPPPFSSFPIPDAGGVTLPQIINSAAMASADEVELTEAGLRYDFNPSAAFKIAATHSENLAGYKADVVRFSIDLVF